MTRLASILLLSWGFLLIAANLQADSGTPQTDYESEDITNRSFDRDEWVRVVRGMQFEEKPTEEKKQPEYTRRTNNNTGAWASVLKVFLIVLGVAILVFLIANMLGGEHLFRFGRQKIKKNRQKITLENLEENIQNAQVDDFIQQAIKEGNFKLAIRLHYLALIKALSNQRLIKWKRDKTNGEYLREVGATPFFDRFRDVTLIFERVWYGDQVVDKHSFQQIQPKFSTLERAILANPLDR